MSKITFRADDDLVERLEALDTSKSEVMREALRAYLDGTDRGGTVDDALAGRVDELIAERLDDRAGRGGSPQDINVNVTLDAPMPPNSDVSVERKTVENDRKTSGENAGGGRENVNESAQTERKTCAQCGENLPSGHVYCPNCGEKSSHRVFCDCGDELRSDWAFCPSCGRRTPAADVLDQR